MAYILEIYTPDGELSESHTFESDEEAAEAWEMMEEAYPEDWDHLIRWTEAR